MKRKVAAAAALAALSVGIFTSYVAFAEQGTAAQREACTPDVYRLCQSEIPNEDRIVACLKRNKKLLSPACHKVIFDE